MKEEVVEGLVLGDGSVGEKTCRTVAEESSTCVRTERQVGDGRPGLRRCGEGVEGDLEGGRPSQLEGVDNHIGCKVGNPGNGGDGVRR